MSGAVNIGGTWRNASGLYAKIDGVWKEITEGYSKKDGAWVQIYSSGALVQYNAYDLPIPVMAGWKHSNDGVNWTTVSSNGKINYSGTFTGFVRCTKELSLTDWYCKGQNTVSSHDNGKALSRERSHLTSFTVGGKGYVAGGRYKSGSSTRRSAVVDIYTSGTVSTTSSITVPKESATSFTNGSNGYIACGYDGSGYKWNLESFDTNGVRTTLSNLSIARQLLTSFVVGGKGYVAGGRSTSPKNTVDVVDSSGTVTTGSSLSSSRSELTSFVNGSKGYVVGGNNGNTNDSNSTVVDVYDTNGSRTTGTPLAYKRDELSSFVNNLKGYVVGGRDGTSRTNYVDVYNINGTRTAGTALSTARAKHTSFVCDGMAYVAGGWTSGTHTSQEYGVEVETYDSNGNHGSGASLNIGRGYLTSSMIGSIGFVAGGILSDATYTNSLETYKYKREYWSTDIPITAGSTYTLNGTSGTAQKSGVIHFDAKVSGTINYMSGVVPRRGFGIKYTKADASAPDTCLTYVGRASGLTPMSGGSGNVTENSWATNEIFNAIKPCILRVSDNANMGYLKKSQMNLFENGSSASSYLSNYSYDVYTEIPAIYQKFVNASGGVVERYLSLEPQEGYELHPSFIVDGVAKPKIYIARHLACVNNSKLYSRAGVTPSYNYTRAQFRSYAKTRSANHHLLWYWDWDLINALYLQAFKTFASQKVVGRGYINGSAVKSLGTTNAYSWMYGSSSDTTAQISFLGIEDWWGHLHQFLDNFVGVSGSYYAGNLANPDDTTTGLSFVGSFAGSGETYPLTCKATKTGFFLSETTGGSATTGMCDRQYWSNESTPVLGRFGGQYAEGEFGDAGAFYILARNPVDFSAAYIGARLTYKP